jgi:hypothetical protein
MKSKGLVEESAQGLRLAATGKEVYLKLRETLPSIL